MKRQKTRKAIIFISFLLFPVTLYYFSPALIIEGAFQGIMTGSFILFSLLFISSLLLGRAFCGWGCPGAGLQEACFMIRDKRARGGRYDWIKYFIWAPWIGIIVFASIKAGGLHSVDPFFQTQYGISIAEPANYPVFYTVVGLITVLALSAGRRGFCHYSCWMAPFMIIGRKVRNALRWPSLRLKPDKDKCINCKTCTENCPMSLDVNHMVQKGFMENTECILCGTCADGCPQKVISFLFRSGT